jgi:WD40 repeat protein
MRISLYTFPDLVVVAIIDKAHEQPLTSFEFSENSKLLISTAEDSTIKFWTIPLMSCNWTINSLQNAINTLEQYIACGNQIG